MFFGNKNHSREFIKKPEHREQRFSLRKFSFGAASILVGSLLFLTPTVSANESEVQSFEPTVSNELSETVLGDTSEVTEEEVATTEPVHLESVDKSALSLALEESDIFLKDALYTNALDHYKQLYLDALNRANQVLNDASATQDDVNAAKQYLEEAKQNALNNQKPVAERTTGITYRVEFVDETGSVVTKVPYTHVVTTTEETASAVVTVAPTDLPAGYRLASDDFASVTHEITEKADNVFSFNVVKEKDIERAAEFTGLRNGTAYTLGNAEFNPKAKLIVTPDNQDNFFRVDRNAHKDGNVVTLTDAARSQVGAYALFNKISMSEDFVLTGRINIGDAYEGNSSAGHDGGDGVAFVFTTANPGETGLAGASIGLGGIANSFGFKLDTFHNTNRPNNNVKSDADPRFTGYKEGAFGAFYYTDRNGVAKYITNDAKRLNVQPTDNSFRDITVTYNGKTKEMIVDYDGQSFTKNLTQWLAEARKTTKHAVGQEEMAFALFASTGGAYNLQQFELHRFEYTAGGAYVVVKHVDAKTGAEIKGPTTNMSDGRTASVDLSTMKEIPGYVVVANNVNTALGYAGGETVNYRTGSQTVTYTYKVDKTELEQLLQEADAIKASSKYYNETTSGDKTAYDDAITKGTTTANTDSATVEQVQQAIEAIKAAKQALDGQETNKSQLEASVNEQSNVQNTAPYYNGSSDKQNAYNDAISKGRDTLNKPNVTQAEVDAALQKIETAKTALDGRDTNKSELEAEIGKDGAVQQSDKYNLSEITKKNEYDDAIAAARQVFAKSNATQAEVDQAKERLVAASAALNGEADRTLLKAKIDEQPGVQKTPKYINETTPEKKQAYDNAIEEGRRVYENPSATQSDINEAIRKITEAYNDLDGSATNKEPLRTAVGEKDATQATPNYYNATPDKKQAYDDAVAKGEEVLAKDNATQAEVDAAKKAIDDAKQALDGSATNKEPLRTAVGEKDATQATPNYYNATPDKKQAYDDAVAKGEEVLAKDNATQAEVDAAKKAIDDAKQALDGSATNKEPLRTAVGEKDATQATPNYYNATPDKKQAYDDAVAKGEEVLAKDNATQAEVDAAKKAIDDAKQALDGSAT
ncbi:lectin-like domain-containing protein, partial [Streptococcus suis]